MAKRFSLLALLLALWASAGTAWAGLLDKLDTPTRASQREFLPPDQAFAFHHEATGPGRQRFVWTIAEGYYLYRDKLKVEALEGSGTATLAELPPGEDKNDDEFGKVRIFRNSLTADVAVSPTVGVAATTLKVTYQGCAEDGICYPPIHKTLTMPVDGAVSNAGTSQAVADTGGRSEVDEISALLAGHGLPRILATFLGFGLLLSLTPCVFPMVPIVSGLVVGEHGRASAWRGLTLSAVYVLAMAAVYALAGLAAGLFGRNLQAAFQHPAVIVVFSAVFVGLALSMFGFFHLQLPAGLRQRLHMTGQGTRGGSLAGAGVMGALSAVIVGPCVAPPLAGALLYLGHEGNPAIGGLALFALGLGMGVPLLLVGASAGHFLPQAGAWLERVQHVFGVVSLGVAIWFLERILPGQAVLALWAALLLGTGVFLGALEPLRETASGWARLWKAAGLGMLFYGAVLIVGVAAGADDLFRPLAPLMERQQAHAAEARAPSAFKPIKGTAGLSQAIAAAAAVGRPSVVDFYADWCVECRKLERETFGSARISADLGNFELFRVDVTANDPTDRALLAELSLFGPPAVLFFDAKGQERREQRLVGFVGPEAFATRLAAVHAP